MKINIFLLSFIGLLSFSSCMKELGNYDYEEVNQIKIDSIEGFRITQFDTLKIIPTITQSMEIDENDLEYLWYWYPTGNIEAQFDTISRDKILNYYVAAEPGQYSARLKITDKKTGIFARKEFSVFVETNNNGILVLSDLNGKANLSILNFAKVFFEDVYYAANGEYAGENPIAVADVDHATTDMHSVVIMCDDSRGGVELDPVRFKKLGDFSGLFYTAPKSIKPQAYCAVANLYNVGMMISFDFIINNGKLYNRDFQNAYSTNRLLFRPEIYGDYKLSPYAFLNSNSLLFYDNANYCFQVLRCARGTINTNVFSPAPLADESEIDKLVFNPRNVGLELVYGGEGWKKDGSSVGYGYGIFRKPGTTALSDMYCLKFNIGSAMSYNPPYGEYFTPYFKNPVSGAVNLEKATTYALSKKDPYLYYAYRNKIYSYDLEYNKGKEIYDIDTVVGAGAKVDYLYIRPGINVDYSLQMWAASSKEGATDKTGCIHVLGLGRNGDVSRVDTVYRNVCGRVVSMSYKNR